MNVFLVAAVLVAFVAAVFDWRTGRMPNAITLTALAAGPIAHFVHGLVAGDAGDGLYEMERSLLGAVACGAVPLFMFTVRGMGGGDVKLFAAIGALALPMIGLEAETYGFVAALFLAPIRLAYDGVLLRTLRNTLTLSLNLFRKPGARKPIPDELRAWFRLGPSIFVGVVAALIAHLGQP